MNQKEDLVFRLLKRAEIRRGIPTRKSVQKGEPDRIADLLEEAADKVKELEEWKMLKEVHDACPPDEWLEENNKLKVKLKTCNSKLEYQEEALKIADEALEQALGAFEKNWAIDWNDLSKARQKIKETLGSIKLPKKFDLHIVE